jgi:hypothetical protein
MYKSPHLARECSEGKRVGVPVPLSIVAKITFKVIIKQNA